PPTSAGVTSASREVVQGAQRTFAVAAHTRCTSKVADSPEVANADLQGDFVGGCGEPGGSWSPGTEPFAAAVHTARRLGQACTLRSRLSQRDCNFGLMHA